MEISKSWFEPFWSGKKKHKNYHKALDVYFHVTFHGEGYFKRPFPAITSSQKDAALINPYFRRLIDDRRPSESDIILKYRRSRYVPITKAPVHTVINSLQKIFKSEDWKVDYSRTDVSKGLPEKDQLQTYCEENFPFNDSITNWASEMALRWSLFDPNSLCVVMPLNYDVDPNEFYSPYPHIINCKDVYEYKENDYAVFLSPYTSTYTDVSGETKNGKIVCIVTNDSFWEARQVDQEMNYILEEKLVHNIGTLPAWLLKGEKITSDPISPYYDSYLSPMLPSLDEMAGDFSDLQAEKIQHLFSERWEIMTSTCTACDGKSTVLKGGKQIVCPTCNGRGVSPRTPYQTKLVNPKNAIGQAVDVPMPPMGYLEKNTKIVELMTDIIEKHAYKALSAVHMQFLWNSPMNTSGISKAYDQQETNNFVHKVAYNLVKNTVMQVYYYVNEIRYMGAIPDKETRGKQLPVIKVPTRFDIITQQALEDNMKNLEAAKASPMLRRLAEMDYLYSRYGEDDTFIDKLEVMQKHNPFPDTSIEELLALKNSGAVKEVDIVLSLYLNHFIDILMDKDSQFATWDYEKQHEALINMAQEIVDSQSAEKALKQKQAIKMMQQTNPVAQVPAQKDSKELSKDTKGRKKERSDLELS